VPNLNTRFKAFYASALFLALGCALIPFAGVQNDEALFGNPLYLFNAKELSIIVFHQHVPLMVMSYVGTLKTWIYSVIFHFVGVSVWTVRLPMVLAGALTVLIFYRFTARAAGPAAALIAAFLLATDPSFLLTNTFDWGPVAIGHLLLVTACFFLLRFQQRKYQMHDLALGFFFLGLGLWNKALMLWAIAGLAGAVLLVFRKEVLFLAWISGKRQVGQAVLPPVSCDFPPVSMLPLHSALILAHAHLLDNLNSKRVETHHLARMIGQQPDGGKPQIGQDLRADTGFLLGPRFPLTGRIMLARA
jgi:hypothetical protein